ncbi:MAG TPA: hypothetical protein VEA40_16670 [Ramlibacter sp.]|nr:hypothetical protein [Ramlibacter sp.]
MQFDEKLHAWRVKENAALEAEQAVAALGQATADPRVAQLLSSARALRSEADQLFAELLADADKAGPKGEKG